MRRIVLSVIICHLSVLATLAQPAHITGKVKDFKEGIAMITQMGEQGRHNDTLRIAADGSFAVDVNVQQTGLAYLLFEDLKASSMLFLEPGMKADLQISFGKKMSFDEEVNSLEIVYTGDNKDVFEFENGYDDFENYKQWPWDKISTVAFADYRKAVDKMTENHLQALYKVSNPAYKEMKGRQLESGRFANLCRWAWGNQGKKDADFERWMLSFDHNDRRNMDKIGNYWRWYMNSNMPPRGERTAASFYDCLKSAFTNQEIINEFADDWIQQTLKEAPEDMDEEVVAYKATSTNQKGHEVADQLYAHYSKLKKGAPAADFDFYDKAGRKFTLKDLRGRAVYIDCWATWCGPCCAEIPYMEKLYAHYKNNKKIELISISLDDNKKKWEKKVAEDKPGWKQYIVNQNFKSLLCKNYDIDGIPRFLMFDKKGRIVSLNAPRPSHEKIIEWIDSQL